MDDPWCFAGIVLAVMDPNQIPKRNLEQQFKAMTDYCMYKKPVCLHSKRLECATNGPWWLTGFGLAGMDPSQIRKRNSER